MGYYNGRNACESTIPKDGWLNTGVLGFMENGRLVVTGRAKDVIIVNGQNYCAHDVEGMAQKVGGELGEVAACGVFNAETQTEEIVLFVVQKDFFSLWFANAGN
jgi:iturin family lipopeptide synthetase A